MSSHSLKALLPGLVGVLLVGCDSGPKLAPVSGVVKLDGKPYANAMVSFQPIASGSTDPGKGSVGGTDEQGRFVMMYDGTKKGAIVGRHRVRISTYPGKGYKEDPSIDRSLGSPDGVIQPKGAKSNLEFDPIPMEWNEKSEHVFEVLAGGTDKADFDIQTKKGGAKK